MNIMRFQSVVMALLVIAGCKTLAVEKKSAFGENLNRVERCAPLGMTKAQLMALRGRDFAIKNERRRAMFAVGLAACLGSPDPQLRDSIGYEGYASLLRNKQLTHETIITLNRLLIDELEGPEYIGQYKKPFTALALSEIARADRIDNVLSAEDRARLVDAAITYMQSIDDYRGFVDTQGWRHGVAHTADLFLHLTLNENVDRSALIRMRAAIAHQIAPDTAHSYIHGESERLARPILFMAARGEIEDADWQSWFETLSDPAPLAGWADALQSEKGLALLHNKKNFAFAVHTNANLSLRAELDILSVQSAELLRALP